MKKSSMQNLFIVTFVLLMSSKSYGTNWIMLQSTEPSMAPKAKLFGSLIADYQYTNDTRLPVGPWVKQKAVFNQIGPRLASSSQLTLRKIKLGVRGALPNQQLNYRLMAMAGDNSVTRLDQGDRVRILDGSVTYNAIPHARLRLGMFKYPGAEEGIQFNAPGNFINYSTMTNQLLLERFFDNDGSNPYDSNLPGVPNTFRDIGLMAFDSFRQNMWEHTYAAMLGNGNGISTSGDSHGIETYLYWSSEYVLGGKGAKQEGIKIFTWLQNGERTLKSGLNSQFDDHYDRRRMGLGITYQQGKFRVSTEAVKAAGMIPNSVDSGGVPGRLNNAGTAVSSYNLLPDENAFGWYVVCGYRLMERWWADVRYDRLDRGTDISSNERKFTTWTLGTSYHFTPKVRLLINYEIRDNEAPNLPDNAGSNQILDSYDDRFGVQLFYFF